MKLKKYVLALVMPPLIFIAIAIFSGIFSGNTPGNDGMIFLFPVTIICSLLLIFIMFVIDIVRHIKG